MNDDYENRDLFECAECKIGIAVTDKIVPEGPASEHFHMHPDGQLCGPIVAIPASQK